MDDHINRGDLVRWIVDYELFAADDTGKTYPLEPVYQYGIVVEVSPEDPSMVVIYNPYQAEWWIGNKAGDQIEIISKAKNMSKSDNESTVEIVTIAPIARQALSLVFHQNVQSVANFLMKKLRDRKSEGGYRCSGC